MAEDGPKVAAAEPAKMSTDEDVVKHGGSVKGKGRLGGVGFRPPKHMRRALSQIIAAFLVLAGVTALILWLVYRPHRPKFSVVSAVVYDLNATTPPFISTTMQFTVVTRNPNDRVSISYDRLSAFVSYKNQMITPPMMLPPLHHDKDSTVAMSPVLGGVPVPVALELANGLVTDMEGYGIVELRLVLQGRLRWKAGPIKTGHYDMYVKCDMLLGLKKGVVGQVPLLGSSSFSSSHDDGHKCKVDI